MVSFKFLHTFLNFLPFLPFNSLKALHRYAILNPGSSVGGIIMKINWYKIASAAQLLIGVAAIVAFFVMAFDGGDIRPWVITVALAVVLVVSGTTGVTKGSPYDDK